MYFYSQTTGIIARSESSTLTPIGKGYAGGDCGENPGGVNNPAMQQVQNVGPLPQGVYTIEVPAHHPKLGPCAMPLIPHPGNAMFGRSGFFIHGDNDAADKSASEGCIVLPGDVRADIAARLQTDNLLTVTQ